MNAKMKIAGVWGIILATVVAGCASAGPQTPPSALDKKLFGITTNVVTVLQTNTVTETNFVEKVVQTTNTLNQVVNVTNLVPVLMPTPQIIPVLQTNYVYDASGSQAMATSLGALGGPWGAVAGAVAAGILGIWGGLKSQQANTAAAVATSGVQAIETARNVIAALPNGAALSAAYDNWLVAHQADADIAKEVGALVDKVVNTNVGTAAGQGAASQILASALQPIIPPGGTATTTISPGPVAPVTQQITKT